MSNGLRFFIILSLSSVVLGARTKVKVSHEPEPESEPEGESEPTLPPVPKEDRFDLKRLPIEFIVDDQAPVLRDGDSNWFCVKIRLLPEDGGDKFAILAKRFGDNGNAEYRVSLRAEDENADIQDMNTDVGYHVNAKLQPTVSEEQTSPYLTARAKTFVVTEHSEQDAICQRKGGVYARYADVQAYVHERMTKEEVNDAPDVREEKDKDVLEKHIEKWNKEQARPPCAGGKSNGCTTRKDCSGHHVSYVKIPDGLQERIEHRLENNWDTFYETYGAGIAGTTGAHFVAGNRGFRRPDWGGEMMELLFPNEADLKEYEDSLGRVVRNRADVIQKLGENADIDFQHRLWRYGPDFSVRGGIWHRDTCPFGIGGGVPEGAWQLTSVYVLYASNLDLSGSGTRLKDRFGKTHEMPCVVGTTNIMRSGENDPVSPWHAGPVLQKVDPNQPAYRVMMQTKLIVSKPAVQKPAGAEKWGALGIPEMPIVSPDEEHAALEKWFYNFSQAIGWGASESNAVGSEAYPINAQRAWARTEEMAHFFGFQGNFLPHFAKPPVDVEDDNEEEPHEDGDKDWNDKNEVPADLA